MYKIDVPQEELVRLANKWPIDYTPRFRRPTCAFCGQTIWLRMWHCWLEEGGYKKEIHLCRCCAKEYRVYD